MAVNIDLLSYNRYFVTQPRIFTSNAASTPAPNSNDSRPALTLSSSYQPQAFENVSGYASVEYMFEVQSGGDLGTAVVGWIRNDAVKSDRFAWHDQDGRFKVAAAYDGFPFTVESGKPVCGQITVPAGGLVTLPDGTTVKIRFSATRDGGDLDLTSYSWATNVTLVGKLKAQDFVALLSLPVADPANEFKIAGNKQWQQEDFVIDPVTKFYTFTKKVEDINVPMPIRSPVIKLKGNGIIDPSIAPTSVSNVQVNGVPQVKGTDYMVDYLGGVLHLIEKRTGANKEVLTEPLFVIDDTQVSNFMLTVNGTPLTPDQYTSNLNLGFINLVKPTLVGDTVQVSYTGGTGVSVVDTFVSTADGQFGFTVTKPPITLSKLTVPIGATSFSLQGDQTLTYVAGRLVRLGQLYVETLNSTYNPTANATQVNITGKFGVDLVNPLVYYTDKDVSAMWVTETAVLEKVSPGFNEFVLLGDQTAKYKSLRLIKLGVDVYQVAKSEYNVTTSKTTITLTTKTVRAYSASTTVRYLPRLVFSEGDTELVSELFPLFTEVFTVDVNGVATQASNLYPVTTPAYQLYRNNTLQVTGTDYTFAETGLLTLATPLVAGDKLELSYMGRKFVDAGVPYSATYVKAYRVTGANMGQALTATFKYYTPDQFYSRITNEKNHFEKDYKPRLEEEIKRASGQVSSGRPVAVPPQDNWQRGMQSDVGRLGQAEEDDWVIKQYQMFLHRRVSTLESERKYLNGAIVGANSGLVTDSQIDTAHSTFPARLFPPAGLTPDRKVFSPTANNPQNPANLVTFTSLDSTMQAYAARVPALAGLALNDYGFPTGAIYTGDYMGATAWSNYGTQLTDEATQLNLLKTSAWSVKPYFLPQYSSWNGGAPHLKYIEPVFTGATRETTGSGITLRNGAYLGTTIHFSHAGRYRITFISSTNFTVDFAVPNSNSFVNLGSGAIGVQFESIVNGYVKFTLQALPLPDTYITGDVIMLGAFVRYEPADTTGFTICTEANTGVNIVPNSGFYMPGSFATSPWPIYAFASSLVVDEQLTLKTKNVINIGYTLTSYHQLTSSQSANKDSAGTSSLGYFTSQATPSADHLVATNVFVASKGGFDGVCYLAPLRTENTSVTLSPAANHRPRFGSNAHANLLKTLGVPDKQGLVTALTNLASVQIPYLDEIQTYQGTINTFGEILNGAINMETAYIQAGARKAQLNAWISNLSGENSSVTDFEIYAAGTIAALTTENNLGQINMLLARYNQNIAHQAQYNTEDANAAARIVQINTHLNNDLYQKRYEWLNYRLNRNFGTLIKVAAVKKELADKANKATELSALSGAL